MGLGMGMVSTIGHWRQMHGGWSRRKRVDLLFSIRVLRASFKGRNADFRTHQVPYQVMTYFAVPFTNSQQKKVIKSNSTYKQIFLIDNSLSRLPCSTFTYLVALPCSTLLLTRGAESLKSCPL
jgi:hypothetical protein